MKKNENKKKENQKKEKGCSIEGKLSRFKKNCIVSLLIWFRYNVYYLKNVYTLSVLKQRI